MHAENFLINDSGHGQAIETIGEGLPDLYIVPPLALVIKAIDAVDGRTLVIAAKDKEVLGELDLKREQQTYRLQRLLSPVHVVAEKQVIGFWRKQPVLK